MNSEICRPKWRKGQMLLFAPHTYPFLRDPNTVIKFKVRRPLLYIYEYIFRGKVRTKIVSPVQISSPWLRILSVYWISFLPTSCFTYYTLTMSFRFTTTHLSLCSQCGLPTDLRAISGRTAKQRAHCMILSPKPHSIQSQKRESITWDTGGGSDEIW